jgi:membrane fusion protein, multidrug efflux system
LVETVEADVAAAQGDRPSAEQGDRRPRPSERSDIGDPADRTNTDSGPAPRKPDRLLWLKRHRIATAVVALAALVVIAAGIAWWLNASQYETTDDAFIDTRPSAISAQVSGAIVDVPVTDNEIVEPGQTLAKIDDRNYAAAKAQAEAQIAQANATIGAAAAQTSAQQATIDQMARQTTEAQAALAYSKDQNQRAQSLLKTGFGTLQEAQQTESDLKQKQAGYDAAEAALAQAKKQLAVIAAQRQVADAELFQAQAQLELAEANLSRVTLTAPFKGRVTELTAAKGFYATPGETLMYVVPLDVWVTANFRETQLADVRPGQPADLCVDAYGRCFPGHVDSVQAGSGTAFSLLPAENATGNYVKVVQRVPVKLVFNKQPDVELGPGMSVTPSVKVR